MNNSQKKEARLQSHTEMMTAFYRFLDSLRTLSRPIEGEQRWSDMLAAFRAGWNA